MYKIDKILIGTHNKGKFKEISDLLPKTIKKISPNELNIESPQENGKSFLQNSEIKADFFCKKSHLTTLSDDSGRSKFGRMELELMNAQQENLRILRKALYTRLN